MQMSEQYNRYRFAPTSIVSDTNLSTSHYSAAYQPLHTILKLSQTQISTVVLEIWKGSIQPFPFYNYF